MEQALPDTISLSLDDVDANHLLPHARRADPGPGNLRRPGQSDGRAPAARADLPQARPAQTEQRVVDPYHLANINGEWFLFAFDHLRKDLRTFVPARIKAIRHTGKTFERRAEVLAGKAAARQLWRPVRARAILTWSSASARGCRLHPREEVARLAATARTQGRADRTAPEALQPGGSRALGPELGRRCRRPATGRTRRRGPRAAQRILKAKL